MTMTTCASFGTRGWVTCTLCKGFVLDKHAKTAFPSSEHRSREILDLQMYGDDATYLVVRV